MFLCLYLHSICFLCILDLWLDAFHYFSENSWLISLHICIPPCYLFHFCQRFQLHVCYFLIFSQRSWCYLLWFLLSHFFYFVFSWSFYFLIFKFSQGSVSVSLKTVIISLKTVFISVITLYHVILIVTCSSHFFEDITHLLFHVVCPFHYSLWHINHAILNSLSESSNA